MRAIVSTKYGPAEHLRMAEVEVPVPEDGEVLMRVRAASINKVDWILMRGKPFAVRLMGQGLLRPKTRIPGNDAAGEVAAVGRAVRRFQPGDAVFGELSQIGRGALADYVCASEYALALKPHNLSYVEAAAAPMAAMTALQGLRDKGRVRAGQKVLVYGASGGVGTFAVQIARSFGAEVTAVCSTNNLDIARSAGRTMSSIIPRRASPWAESAMT